MSQPLYEQFNHWKDVQYKYEVFNNPDFADFTDVIQVYGVMLNDKNEILVVSKDGEGWMLPGGGVEKGEEMLETLNRELYEEAAVFADQSSFKQLFYQKTYRKENKNEAKWRYVGKQVRFLCKLSKQDKFIEDPDDNGIKFQKWVKIDELRDYLKWGQTVELICDSVNQVL